VDATDGGARWKPKQQTDKRIAVRAVRFAFLNRSICSQSTLWPGSASIGEIALAVPPRANQAHSPGRPVDEVRSVVPQRGKREQSRTGLQKLRRAAQKDGKSNITDTQSALFEYDHLNCTWQHRTWGSPPDPGYPWALFIYGDKGVLKASTMRADFVPNDKSQKPFHFDCVYEKEKYPEDTTEEGIELNAAPATRLHMPDFLAAIDKRSRPVADVEEGHISTASCILANLSQQTGRPMVYDPARRVVVNDREATRLLARPYRRPWQRPRIEAA